MFALRYRAPLRNAASLRRMVSTLSNNEYIRVFKDSSSPSSSILTYLESDPPSKRLAIGTTTELPPTPRSFTENKHFLKILDDVLREYGHLEEDVASQARALATPPSFQLSPGGGNPRRKGARSEPQGASGQGGAGGAGVGSFVHLGDSRHPPEFGRIACPEDILGSVEVSDGGEVSGKMEPSGTYRPLTNDGILGLTPFIRGKLIERLKQEESKEKGQ